MQSEQRLFTASQVSKGCRQLTTTENSSETEANVNTHAHSTHLKQSCCVAESNQAQSGRVRGVGSWGGLGQHPVVPVVNWLPLVRVAKGIISGAVAGVHVALAPQDRGRWHLVSHSSYLRLRYR